MPKDKIKLIKQYDRMIVNEFDSAFPGVRVGRGVRPHPLDIDVVSLPHRRVKTGFSIIDYFIDRVIGFLLHE